MKGVSEVIAIILILMITIAIAGLAYTFMSSTMASTTSAASSAVTTTTSSMLTSFVIESIDGNKIYLRNTGQTIITDMAAYVNEVVADYKSPDSIAPGEVNSINITNIIFRGDIIRVTSSGGLSAEKPSPSEYYGSVCYWKFDEGTGSVAYDSSVSAKNGNLMNGVGWTNGKYGNAILFDGTNDYVNTNYNQNFNGLSQITVSIWVNPARTYTAEPNMWYFFTTKYNDPFEFGYQGWDDAVAFKPYNSTGSSFGVGVVKSLQNNVWYHYVGVVNGSFVGLYENGVLISSRSDFVGTLENNGNVLTIGGLPAGSFFNGTIDDLAIWNRSLDAQEVLKLYNKAIY